MDPGAEPSELVVETLLADLALTRLGTLLQGARENSSTSRRDVASKVGTTARALRRYETGAVPVPRGIVTALAEFYGEDLNSPRAHGAAVPAQPARAAEAVDAVQTSSGEADDVLRAYVGILGRDPRPTPSESVTLHPGDIAALSTALAVEPEQVKGRIAELLTFTTGLRRKTRLRRRKRLLSGAGVAAVLATGAGFGIGALVGAAPSRADQVTSGVTASSTTATSSTTVASTSTTAAPTSTALASTSTTVAVTPPPVTIAPPPVTAPPTTSLGIATAVTVVETTTSTTTTTTTTTIPRPVISTDTTPISIPGTEPVTIITGG